MFQSPELSVVILCYRSGDSAREFVPQTVEALKKSNVVDYELILVANYLKNSKDKTPRTAADLASKNKKIRYIAKVKEGMLGWDVRSGMDLAKGKYIAVIDGDGQMPKEDIIRVYKKIKSGKFDLVKTYRIERGDSLWRKIISNYFNILFHIFFPGLKSRDINSKPKIITREAYKKLELSADDWFVDAEIMIQARRFGFRIGEIPTVFLGLTGRRSFVTINTIFEFIINLFRYKIREFGYSYEYTNNRSTRRNRKKTG